MPEEWAAIQTPRCAGENTSVWEEMGTLLLQHCHSGIFQELYTHFSSPWGSRHHEIRDDGCSISNSKSYCDFNWIAAAILFFSRASRLSISSLLPVIQQFIPHCTNPSIRQFLIPFKQCLWQQVPIALVFGALPFFIKQEFISDMLWLPGSTTFPAMRSPHTVLGPFSLSAHLMTALQELKKETEKWKPGAQRIRNRQWHLEVCA